MLKKALDCLLNAQNYTKNDRDVMRIEPLPTGSVGQTVCKCSGGYKCTYQPKYHLGEKMYAHKILNGNSKQNLVKYLEGVNTYLAKFKGGGVEYGKLGKLWRTWGFSWTLRDWWEKRVGGLV